MKNTGSILVFAAALLVSGTLLYLSAKKTQEEAPHGISQVQMPKTHDTVTGKTQVVSVTEICHAGYVYLVTSNGAITARIRWNTGKMMPVECQK